jgi:hypothetical protein
VAPQAAPSKEPLPSVVLLAGRLRGGPAAFAVAVFESARHPVFSSHGCDREGVSGRPGNRGVLYPVPLGVSLPHGVLIVTIHGTDDGAVSREAPTEESQPRRCAGRTSRHSPATAMRTGATASTMKG